jgi:hypothetical protein
MNELIRRSSIEHARDPVSLLGANARHCGMPLGNRLGKSSTAAKYCNATSVTGPHRDRLTSNDTA